MAAALLVMTPTSTAFAQANVTQNDIQVIKDELADIQAQKKEAEERLAAIRHDLSQAEEQVELIQGQVLLTEQEINAGQALLDGYDARIARQEQDIQGLEEQEAEQYQEFYKQVRWLEESGNLSYLSILLEARSFSEMLDYAMLVVDIMNYSQRIIQELEATQAELDAVRADLQADRDAQAESSGSWRIAGRNWSSGAPTLRLCSIRSPPPRASLRPRRRSWRTARPSSIRS